MTPGEYAREALYGFSAFSGGTLQAIEETIRAALRERDQQWRKALDQSHYDSIDGLHAACAGCDPLAALLKETET